jgi:hypothetical protein
VDYFGRDQLKELFRVDMAPAVSIYMGTHRRGAEVAAQPLRLRAAIEEAKGLLAADGARADDVLEPLEALVGDREFWNHQADGLALFASQDFGRLYRLPVRLRDMVVVGPTFHTKPLIEFLQAPERFWVLAVSQKEVRIWEGLSPIASICGVHAEEEQHPSSTVMGRGRTTRNRSSRSSSALWTPAYASFWQTR